MLHFFIDRIEEPTVHLTVLIVLLNMIRWFMMVISRINVGALLVPPISKYKIYSYFIYLHYQIPLKTHLLVFTVNP
jgi:hypothetical protein